MVTPAAPRSRSTSAAPMSMLVRVDPRFVEVLVIAGSGDTGWALRHRSPDEAARGEHEAAPVRELSDEPQTDDVELDHPHDLPLSL